MILKVSQNEDKLYTMVDKCNSVDKLLNGGLAVNLDLNDLHSDSEVRNAIMAASDSQPLELNSEYPLLKMRL
jgi:hypothetical protein